MQSMSHVLLRTRWWRRLFLDDFAGAFEKRVRVDKGVVLGGVHCLELCRAGRGWCARVFGWAVECGVAFGMREK